MIKLSNDVARIDITLKIKNNSLENLEYFY